MANRKIRVNRESGGGTGDAPVEMDDRRTGKVGGKVSENGDDSTKDREYDPTREGSQTGDGEGERTPTGRKKRKYGKRKGKRDDEENSPENLTKILIQSHVMLAKLLDVQELMLTEEEGTEFASAIQRVNELYDNEWISAELSAWINLGIVGISIYVPRWMAFNIRSKKEKQQQRPIDISARQVENAEQAS